MEAEVQREYLTDTHINGTDCAALIAGDRLLELHLHGTRPVFDPATVTVSGPVSILYLDRYICIRHNCAARTQAGKNPSTRPKRITTMNANANATEKENGTI